MRLHPEGLTIRVRTDPAGRPQLFVHEGKSHRVATIEEVREPRLEWWAITGEAHRIYYLVTTNEGMICEIYEDRGSEEGGWWLARVFD